MSVSVKGLKIAQPIATRFAVLSKYAFEFNGNLDDYRRTHRDEFAGRQRDRGTGAGSKRDVDHPVVLTNLLTVPETRDEPTTGGSLANQRTVLYEITHYNG
jgi:hypothetical protein